MKLDREKISDIFFEICITFLAIFLAIFVGGIVMVSFWI